jgi:hypothetical protein
VFVFSASGQLKLIWVVGVYGVLCCSLPRSEVNQVLLVSPSPSSQKFLHFREDKTNAAKPTTLLEVRSRRACIFLFLLEKKKEELLIPSHLSICSPSLSLSLSFSLSLSLSLLVCDSAVVR